MNIARIYNQVYQKKIVLEWGQRVGKPSVVRLVNDW